MRNTLYIKHIVDYLLCRMRGKEEGFSMLEYAAGAAVLAGVVYAAMVAFGSGMEGFFQALGQWATDRAGDVTGGGSN